MSRAKKVTLEAIGSLPETSTMDDVLDKVNLVAQVLEGLADAEAGRTLTTDQLLRKVDEEALMESIREADAGELIDGDEVLRELGCRV